MLNRLSEQLLLPAKMFNQRKMVQTTMRKRIRARSTKLKSQVSLLSVLQELKISSEKKSPKL
jgi:hypothetical protein